MTKIITTTAIMKMIIIIRMIIRIKISNRMKIYKRYNRIKSTQIKVIDICLKWKNVQKAMFYWNAKIT